MKFLHTVLSRIWLPFHHMDSCTTLQLHITPPQTTTPIIHCTHDAHSPHHCTNHTVTYHSFALNVTPHLHLIHTPTYKQHTSMHTLRSLVLAMQTFLSVIPVLDFLLPTWTVSPFMRELCLPNPTLPALSICSVICLPPALISSLNSVFDSVLPTWYLTPGIDLCL